MKAIIVAGGRGERLRPITDTIPKPMVEVHGKPILLHTVELLKQAGITEFIFALCYLPEVVKNYFGDGTKFDIQVTYTFEDPAYPKGTAGAIKDAQKHISDTFIVTYADIIRELDIKQMVEQHKKTQALATINTYKRYGDNPKSAITFDSTNKVTQFIERPQFTTKNTQEDTFVWANGSFYIFEPEIFEYIPDNEDSDFGKDIFPHLIKKSAQNSSLKIYSFPSEGFFIDIGTKEKLEKAENVFKTVPS